MHFPAGWGAPDSLTLFSLQPWKDLPVSAEVKAFSGNSTYITIVHVNNVSADKEYVLDPGKVDMAAKVMINGKQAGKLLAPPYQVSLQGMVKEGDNMLSIELPNPEECDATGDASSNTVGIIIYYKKLLNV